VSPLQAWVEQTADAAADAASAVEAQSAVFSDTKARLSPPVAVPDKAWWNDLWPGETNYDKALEAKQANSIRNLELVRSYGESTQSNTDRYPAFGDPVVVDTDVSQLVKPVTPPSPGIVEWPAAPPRRPATGGDSPPSAPPELKPSTPAAPPIDERPPSQSGLTISSGQAESSIPTRQDTPASRVPAGAASADFGAVPSESSGRMLGGRAGEPGGRGPDGRPGAGGRTGGVPEHEAVAGRQALAGRETMAGARGGNPGGMVPAGRTEGDEDEEHRNKFGPFGWHDEFWDDTPPVAPAVIGVDGS
jgi:hypothetical protein